MRMRHLRWLSVAATPWIAIANGIISSAVAGDTCLTSPGSQTDPGTHWYYRMDRTTNQQCWHSERLRETVAKGSAVPRLARTPKTGLVKHRAAVTVERSVGLNKDIPRTPAVEQKGSTVLPVHDTEREVLFRQFLEWYQQELMGTE